MFSVTAGVNTVCHHWSQKRALNLIWFGRAPKAANFWMKLIFNEANIRKKEELRKVFLKAEAEDTKIGEEKISEDCLMIRKPIWI